MSDKTHNGNYDPSPVPRWLHRFGFWRVADNPIFQMEGRNFKKSRGRRFLWGISIGIIVTSGLFAYLKITNSRNAGEFGIHNFDIFMIMVPVLFIGLIIILLRGLIETLIIGPIRLRGEIESSRMNFLMPVPMDDSEIFSGHFFYNLYKAFRSNDWMFGFLLSSSIFGTVLGYILSGDARSVTISSGSILTSIIILLAGIFLYIAIRSKNLTFGYLMAACIVFSLPVLHFTEDYSIIYSLVKILGIMAGVILGIIMILVYLFLYIYLSALTGTMYQFRFSAPYSSILAFIHVIGIWLLCAAMVVLCIDIGPIRTLTGFLLIVMPVHFGFLANLTWLTNRMGVMMFGGFRRAM